MTDEEIVKTVRQILTLRKGNCAREIWLNTATEKKCKDLTQKLREEFDRRDVELKRKQEKTLW
jgi:hypothetical protein